MSILKAEKTNGAKKEEIRKCFLCRGEIHIRTNPFSAIHMIGNPDLWVCGVCVESKDTERREKSHAYANAHAKATQADDRYANARQEMWQVIERWNHGNAEQSDINNAREKVRGMEADVIMTHIVRDEAKDAWLRVALYCRECDSLEWKWSKFNRHAEINAKGGSCLGQRMLR